MAEYSNIAWTDGTLNFWHGCLKVSPGCENCYAETLSKRMGREIWGPAKTTSRMKTKSPWLDCLRWDAKAEREGQRKKVFVMSMGDFFEDHPQVTQWRNQALGIMQGFKMIDVQLLTKRPENISDMVPPSWMRNWPEHIWIGTSVEIQATADKRIYDLLNIPAKIRFLSIEPMLEPIQIYEYIYGPPRNCWWVIVGGESGPNFRPFDWDWARDIRDQCQAAGVPFFMKQGGGWPNKREHLNDLPADLRIREFPQTQAPEIQQRPVQSELFK